MPLTFYTVLVEQDGFPVKYCQPQDAQGLSYGRVQTFRRKAQPFADPGEASGEFEAWIGARGVPCYLDPPRFRAKVKKLHERCPTNVRKQKPWSELVGPRLEVMQQTAKARAKEQAIVRNNASRQQPANSNAIEPDERRWNSTCRSIGHDWQSTTSATFRRCIRTGCQAVQRRRGDWWAYVPLKQQSSQQRSKQADTEQPSLL